MRTAPLKNFNSKDNTRYCTNCKTWKKLDNFSTRIRSIKLKGILTPSIYYRNNCKDCSIKSLVNGDKYKNAVYRKEKYRKDPRKFMLSAAKARAKAKGLFFNIDITDIIIPDKCPLLGIDIKISHNILSENSPSLDRLIPNKGYVKGNILVVSFKANSIKQNATLTELKTLVLNLERVLNKEEELLES